MMTKGAGSAAAVIIDADSHISEPADLWTSRMSAARWGDAIPHIVRDASGVDRWHIGDEEVMVAVTSVFVKGEQPGEPVRWAKAFPEQPKTLDVQHPSSYDARERLAVMDASGVRAAALYPNLGLFFMGMLGDRLHPDFQIEVTRAYNDFLAEWVTPDPSRFVPMAQVPYWDVPAAVAEIERAAALGHRGIIMSGAPHRRGLPYFADRHWDPLWAAAQAHRMPVHFHVGGGSIIDKDELTRELRDRFAVEGSAMVFRMATGDFFDNGIKLIDLLFSGVPARFPNLQFVMVETGVGHIPFLLEACDYHFSRANATDRPDLELLPSEYFHRQVFSTFWFEQVQPWHVEAVGADNMLFETDYPHATSLYGQEVEQAVRATLGRLDRETADKLLWGNAARLYGI